MCVITQISKSAQTGPRLGNTLSFSLNSYNFLNSTQDYGLYNLNNLKFYAQALKILSPNLKNPE